MPHSPAPWTVHRASEHTDDAADSGIMSIRAADGTTVVYTDSGYFHPKEDDAALIAAAPDLLKMLKRTERELTAGLNPQFNQLDYEQGFSLVRAIREAITKATVKT